MSEDAFGVAFKTLGCKVNQVESEDLAVELLGKGARLVDEGSARVVVVNTCTVTAEADAKARKAIRRALSAPHAPVVVVTGCLAALSRDSVEELGDRVIVEADKDLVASRVAEALGTQPANDGSEIERQGGETPRRAQGLRTRAMLKIEDGCDAFCSYCIVPFARGAPRAVPLSTIRSRAEILVRSGVREIVLTGVNLGRYRDGDIGLTDVVRAVAATGIERLRLSSVEPLDLTDDLLDTLGSLSCVCPHLHVPLQSASTEVLAAMARSYTAAHYADVVSRARRAIPGLAITTDVIAGFPGESDADANATVEFCRKMAFTKLHVFRYSRRKGTAAADMPAKIAPELIAERAVRLRELDAELQQAFAKGHEGQDVEVLVERVVPNGSTPTGLGTARDYLKVAVEAEGRVNAGDTVQARVVDADRLPVRAVQVATEKRR